MRWRVSVLTSQVLLTEPGHSSLVSSSYTPSGERGAWTFPALTCIQPSLHGFSPSVCVFRFSITAGGTQLGTFAVDHPALLYLNSPVKTLHTAIHRNSAGHVCCWPPGLVVSEQSSKNSSHSNTQAADFMVDRFEKCLHGLSYSWWGFQAWDTLHDSTGNSSIDKAETNLDWQEYFSQLQDTTGALPCHIHLSVCLWIMDPHSRALWKWGATARYYTSHTKTMLPTRKSVPKSSRHLDHMKISWRS